MFGQDDQPGVRVGAQGQGNLACQPKAGAAVRDPDQVITKAVPR